MTIKHQKPSTILQHAVRFSKTGTDLPCWSSLRCRASWFSPIDPSRCVVNESKAGAIWNWDDTNYFMGPIHPRPKLWVGKRLAAGAHALGYNGSGPVGGPVVSSCAVSADGNSITVSFNASLSRGDTLSVGEYNRSAAVASGMQVLINGSTQTGKGGPTVPGLWVPVQIAAGATAGTVAVDISALRANGTAVHGVRYAWKENPCCDGVYGGLATMRSSLAWLCMRCPLSSSAHQRPIR